MFGTLSPFSFRVHHKCQLSFETLTSLTTPRSWGIPLPLNLGLVQLWVKAAGVIAKVFTCCPRLISPRLYLTFETGSTRDGHD